jgi:hypothetical protein
MDADVDADVDWRTADFEPGDVVALSADVVHMSASNESGSIRHGKGARVRLSCDTRWQPRSERTDPRIRVWRRRLGGDVVDEVREPSGQVACKTRETSIICTARVNKLSGVTRS